MIREAAEFLGIADPFFRVHRGHRRRRNRDRRQDLRQFRLVQLHRAQRSPRDHRGGEGGDRPLRHLGLGEPSGLRRTPDSSRARTGIGATARRRRQRRLCRRPFDQRHRHRASARAQRRHRSRRADPQQHRPGGDPVRRPSRAVSPISITKPPTGCSARRVRATGTRCSSSRAITAWTAMSPICRPLSPWRGAIAPG